MSMIEAGQTVVIVRGIHQVFADEQGQQLATVRPEEGRFGARAFPGDRGTYIGPFNGSPVMGVIANYDDEPGFIICHEDAFVTEDRYEEARVDRLTEVTALNDAIVSLGRAKNKIMLSTRHGRQEEAIPEIRMIESLTDILRHRIRQTESRSF